MFIPRTYRVLVIIFFWRPYFWIEALVYWMQKNTEEEIYGGGIAGGASQPPMLIALHDKVTTLAPEWHVRHFGWWMGNKYSEDILRMYCVPTLR